MPDRGKKIIGNKYNRWTVLSYSHTLDDGRIYYKCQCECGNIRTITKLSLTNGTSVSCGCYHKERLTKYPKGITKEKLYSIWHNMKDRCYRKKHPAYHRYGSRGITVCNEWLNDYLAFRSWSYDNGYKENAKLTIDRKDNDKGYSPDNCCFSTYQEQANNTKNCRYITYKDQTHTLAQWGDITGFGYALISQRLKRGWTIEKALNTPIDKRFSNVKK